MALRLLRRIAGGLIAALLYSLSTVAAFGDFMVSFDPKPLGKYVGEQTYPLQGGLFLGQSILDPANKPTVLVPGGTPGLLEDLKLQFGADGTIDKGWTWQAGPALKNSTFLVEDYEAVGTSTKVGGTLTFIYRPGAGDPMQVASPAKKGDIELHWIQRVVDNDNITDNPGYGNPEDTIDITKGSKTPFYDVGPAFDTRPPIFQDGAYRFDTQHDINFNAELFLVSNVVGTKTITIYSGVTWGWFTRVEREGEAMAPEPPSVVTMATGLSLTAGLFGLGLIRRLGRQHCPCQ